jgi:hypothetical protein
MNELNAQKVDQYVQFEVCLVKIACTFSLGTLIKSNSLTKMYHRCLNVELSALTTLYLSEGNKSEKMLKN